MPSLKSEFRFHSRGFQETLILIPGWATDWRIFDGLELDYNYLLITKPDVSDFNRRILDKIDQLKINKVSVLGFSLGGFLAAEFASAYPARIAELILVGVRKQYEPQLLINIKREILKDLRPWLYKFYLNCFSRADKLGLAWFRQNLLKEYSDKLNADELIRGLDYLASHALPIEALKRIEAVSIFHGADDIVALPKEVLEIKAELPKAKFKLLADRGHLCFLGCNFRENFYHG